MRILHMIEALDVGGMERNLLTLVLGQKASGMDVSIACSWRGGEYLQEFERAGLSVDILDAPRYYSPEDFRTLREYVRRICPDVFHVHGEPASVGCRLAGIFERVRVVLMHAQNRPKPPRRLRHKVQNFLLTLPTAGIIACADDTADYYAEVDHIPRNKLVTVHNCVAPEFLEKTPRSETLRRELGAERGEILVGTIARLTHVKGHRFLLEAAKQVLSEHPRLRFAIVGDGPERGALEKQARELAIDGRVSFCGFRKDIPAVLRALDLFVLPTAVVEGLPLSIAEAMAAKLPVIATDVGGVKEIVHNRRTGLLVPPRNVDALAEAISFMLENRTEANRMAEAGFELCMEEYAPDRMVARVAAVYECALRGCSISRALRKEPTWS